MNNENSTVIVYVQDNSVTDARAKVFETVAAIVIGVALACLFLCAIVYVLQRRQVAAREQQLRATAAAISYPTTPTPIYVVGKREVHQDDDEDDDDDEDNNVTELELSSIQ